MSITLDGILGFLGSIIGVYGAYWVMKKQITADHQKEKENNKPIIILGNSFHKEKELKLGYDLGNPDLFLKNGVLSTISMPLINGGKTPIFNIRAGFHIINHNNIFEKYMDFNSDTFKIHADSKELNYVCRSYDSMINQTLNLNGGINRYPILMPNEQIEIPMPPCYIALIQHYFTNIHRTEQLAYPIVLIKIVFSDYEMNEVTKDYYVVMNECKKSYKRYSNVISFRLLETMTS
ncbi:MULTISPECIES: hypothetical protein [Jeotgalibaca]|uniref:hypothetical protein n=1 Tax=Jeotgalibaca TaxID=1470540 RepID=UPI00359FE514